MWRITTCQSFPHSQSTFLHIFIPSCQLTVSMHQIGSLICNQHNKLMAKMTILFLLCWPAVPGTRHKNIHSFIHSYGRCFASRTNMTMHQVRYVRNGNISQIYLHLLVPLNSQLGTGNVSFLRSWHGVNSLSLKTINNTISRNWIRMKTSSNGAS